MISFENRVSATISSRDFIILSYFAFWIPYNVFDSVLKLFRINWISTVHDYVRSISDFLSSMICFPHCINASLYLLYSEMRVDIYTKKSYSSFFPSLARVYIFWIFHPCFLNYSYTFILYFFFSFTKAWAEFISFIYLLYASARSFVIFTVINSFIFLYLSPVSLLNWPSY